MYSGETKKREEYFVDCENRIGEESLFTDDSRYERIIRHAFIRKVYGIVFSQLAATAFVCLLFLHYSGLRIFIIQNVTVITLLSFIGSFITLCVMVCSRGGSRDYPSNYILLSFFTLFESVLVGAGTCFYDSNLVLQAFCATTLITLGLTLFAFQTKYDFTSWFGVLYNLLLAFLLFGLLRLIFWRSAMMDLIYSTGIAVLFSFYLVLDTQALIGRGAIKYETDDYIRAALSIYLDVLNLFLAILRLLSNRRR